jgi:hypothetical protein
MSARTVAKRSASVRKMFDLVLRLKTRASARQVRMAVGSIAANSEPATQAPPEWLASLYNSERAEFSAAKANDILKSRPRVDFASAQAATLQWLVENGRMPAPTAMPRD